LPGEILGPRILTAGSRPGKQKVARTGFSARSLP
jgi:hypothetical protein